MSIGFPEDICGILAWLEVVLGGGIVFMRWNWFILGGCWCLFCLFLCGGMLCWGNWELVDWFDCFGL
jgi:hypothetical protein